MDNNKISNTEKVKVYSLSDGTSTYYDTDLDMIIYELRSLTEDSSYEDTFTVCVEFKTQEELDAMPEFDGF